MRWLFWLLPLWLYADAASIVGGKGGSLHIQENTHIQMLSETISIDVSERYALFEIQYRFANTSEKKQQVSMGFPQKKGKELSQKLFNFKTLCNAQPVPISLHVSPSAEAYDFYHFEIGFAPKEHKEIINRYWVYPTEYQGLYSLFYTLHTGASWKGPIKNITVLVSLDAPFIFAPKQLAKSNIHLLPKGYTLHEGRRHLSWYFSMIEPSENEDIELYYIKEGTPYAALSDTASSTFNDTNPEEVYFGAENLLDGDPNMTWATNNPKGPIGEWVQIDLHDAPHDLYEIAIYPGYGTYESFMMADHLKAATLFFSDGNSQKVAFEEEPRMHYFDLNASQTRFVKIRIDEVYQGLWNKKGYRGTAHIGEVKLYSKE